MLTKLLVTPLFIAASAVAHPSVKRRGDVSLSDWSSQNLESFWSFKNRYSSLNCASQTGTDFYTTCCYPLGASESLSSRPAECTPASLTCANFAAASVPTPTPTPDASSSSDDYDESTLPFCEEGDDGYDYDDGSDDTYTDASYNNNSGGSSSSDTYTPPASSDNSQAQPTNSGSSSDSSGNTSGNTSGSNTSNNSGGSTSGDVTGGFATYYYQNNNAGSCGDVNPDSAFIGAIDTAWYGDTSVKSQYCGRSVHITNLNNGKTVDIVIADACPSCVGDNSIDLSVAAFSALDDLSTGTFPISWHFN